MRSRHKAEPEAEAYYYLSVRDFCTRFGVGRSRLYEFIRDGKITAKKNGSKVLISVASAQRHFESLPDFRPGESEAHPD
jgi:excisionase family DNA binding protein